MLFDKAHFCKARLINLLPANYLHPQSLLQSQGLHVLQGSHGWTGAAQPVTELQPNATVIFSLGLTEVTLLPFGSTRYATSSPVCCKRPIVPDKAVLVKSIGALTSAFVESIKLLPAAGN